MASGRNESPSKTPEHGHGELVALAMLLVVLVGQWVPPAHALTGAGSGGAGADHAVQCLGNLSGSLRATPQSVDLWNTATLSTDIAVAPGCTTIRFYLNGQLVAPAGTMTVQPIANSTYSLKARYPGYGERAMGIARVAVTLPKDPSQPGRNLVSITANNLRPLFLQALWTPNTTVIVANQVEMDLGNLYEVTVADGVVLIGGRGGLDPGPRLYTTVRPPAGSGLFRIRGDNVRITGVRIEGPDAVGVATDDVPDSRGILFDTVAGEEIHHIEIDHDEIYGWNLAAIHIWDTGDKLAYSDIPAVHIHDNYIHHNQHIGKNGYGVAVAYGAYTLIEHNVFDFNRHAIEGDGLPGTAYAAIGNLVLRNGGLDQTIPYWTGLGLFYHEVYTHQFDMHGTKNCDIDGVTGTAYNCGPAGDQMYIRYNTFLYTNGSAIKLRGTPGLTPFGMFVGDNVFAHDNICDAVEQTESGVLIEPGDPTGSDPGGLGRCVPGNNQVGVDASNELGSCDFDGDGVNDSFMATGASWWYASGGQMPWVYLNTSTKRLSELTLGYLDGDHRCDVAVDGTIYGGGTTALPPILSWAVGPGVLAP
jgi:hypothetical protein